MIFSWDEKLKKQKTTAMQDRFTKAAGRKTKSTISS